MLNFDDFLLIVYEIMILFYVIIYIQKKYLYIYIYIFFFVLINMCNQMYFTYHIFICIYWFI